VLRLFLRHRLLSSSLLWIGVGVGGVLLNWVAAVHAGLRVGDSAPSVSEACTFALGWGHTGEAADYYEQNKSKNVITQGCYVGDTGGGVFSGSSISQTGPNGSWFGSMDNVVSNGGFSLFDFEKIKETDLRGQGDDEILKMNNLQGFMRLTQVHTMQIQAQAFLAVRDGRCSKAKVRFECLAQKSTWGDLDQKEFTDRIDTAFPKVKPDFESWKRVTRPYGEVLFQLSQKCGRDLVCLKNAQGQSLMGSFPQTCGEELVISTGDTMTRECVDCLQWVMEYQNSPETEKALRDHLGPRSTWKIPVNDNWVIKAPPEKVTPTGHRAPTESWRSLRYY
jgi:hypothetical protein